MYEHCTFVIGCYPCLYCLVYNHNMATPVSVRGRAPSRTFEAICADHQHYIASEANTQQAKHFHNCITEPIFNIPISQVGIVASRNVLHDPPHPHTQPHTTPTQPLPHIHTYNAKVCPPGLHITLGVFIKLYGLLEDECHNLTLSWLCIQVRMPTPAFLHIAKSCKSFTYYKQRWSKPNSHMMNCSKW